MTPINDPLVRTTIWDASTLEMRFAKHVAARLSGAANELPHEVNERLRVSRERALERARWATQPSVKVATSVSAAGAGEAVLRGGSGWGWRLASLVPVLAMVAGLLLVQSQQESDQTVAAADIDAALLSDDLPPAAYSDAGFAEFIRGPGR